jgi:hypothetical protein
MGLPIPVIPYIFYNKVENLQNTFIMKTLRMKLRVDYLLGLFHFNLANADKKPA